jgi:hypothetical protein
MESMCSTEYVKRIPENLQRHKKLHPWATVGDLVEPDLREKPLVQEQEEGVNQQVSSQSC